MRKRLGAKVLSACLAGSMMVSVPMPSVYAAPEEVQAENEFDNEIFVSFEGGGAATMQTAPLKIH